jgi:enamine deaminase RidA (YjgF/YER057c/UK114 family)
MPITHIPAPAGIKAPPLSFAARTGDLLFISGMPGFDSNGALPEGFERSLPMSSPTSRAC